MDNAMIELICSVMVVDPKITFALHRQRHSAVFCKGMVHLEVWLNEICGNSYRNIFSFFRKKQESGNTHTPPVLSEDDLFHPFSNSPFPAVKARGQVVQSLAPCPAQPRAVSFECPDCGWPSHCSEEHWELDEEHRKYCSRLREVNEDEHDLRSGRKMHEFQMPGPQAYEEAISFANWDVFWYTRGFPSMDTERSRRHASKLLTYPLTIGSILHQNSGLTLSNQRVTPEGSRSLAALRTTLHVPPGSPDTEEAGASKPQMRIFILGARAESSLPPHVWEQLCMLFPSCHFHLHFIGPSSIELFGVPSYTVPYTPQLTITGMQATYMEVHQQFQDTFDPYTDLFVLFSPGFGFPSPSSVSELDGQPLLQIASPTEWGPVIPALLATRCPIFVTGFSPADVERDIRSIETAPEVAGEFDWVVTPGPNAFGSEKWEVADFDPRVMVKTNWGVWGIRGKGREVREKSGFSLF
ncbi:hypothetical protein SERLADRAFT_372244 [Serpula lacrymans var. lacrymans S7.9]|uniref:Uncharacterized protein n=1 Tax=Serpula lacrymans var. lacrymans (strain S7.9) TaxID=578457 RepID=F8P4R9_SERL9|nr:uncharacterized protein SERLADRAFT_372244 [Serpula lacrymans var. lacrymans S7.9]EGO21606.1 hypothetical protein SERLADRAFT_372244 [Serpula lacrymans var. lacrymans S7.9]